MLQRRAPMTGADWAAMALAVVGALNWGLVGLFEFDLVATLFGRRSALSRIVYAAVGVAGGWLLARLARAAQG